MKKCVLIGFWLLSLSFEGWAQELSPRAYWPAPKGTQVLSVGVLLSEGDTIPDPSLPITGVDSDITTLVVGYLRTLELWGRTSNVVLELPYSEGKTVGDFTDEGLLDREYQGVGDLAVTLSVNLLGAPSMNREQFADLRRDPVPIFGASVKLVAPTGRYDNNRLINVSANRWAAKFEVGYIGVMSQKWHVEMEAGVWFFGDNDDFVGRRKEQDPLGALELHLVRRIKPGTGLWASLDGNFYTGGRSTVGGRRLNDLQRDSKIGLTLAYPFRGFGGFNAVKMSYSHGSINDSDEDFNSLSLSYQRLF